MCEGRSPTSHGLRITSLLNTHKESKHPDLGTHEDGSVSLTWVLMKMAPDYLVFMYLFSCVGVLPSMYVCAPYACQVSCGITNPGPLGEQQSRRSSPDSYFVVVLFLLRQNLTLYLKLANDQVE